MNSHLLAILSSIQQQCADLATVERILHYHYAHATIQREGQQLLADLSYYHLPISITYTFYEEIRGAQRVPRINFELHLYGHYYLPQQPTHG